MALDGRGVKYDTGKLRYDLIPLSARKALATILTYGAEKYDDHNWRRGMRYGRVIASFERHWNAWREGETVDPIEQPNGVTGTGLPHLWHALCNLVFLIEYEEHPERYIHLDDRFEVVGFTELDEDAIEVTK